MILPAGTFKVSDYRKAVPVYVKLAVLIRQECKDTGGERFEDDVELEFDHSPALVNRDYDTEAGDFIPPQNDPKFIVASRKAEHLEKTTGRKAGAEKTVTTRGSDVGEAARTRGIKRTQAAHQARMEAKQIGAEVPVEPIRKRTRKIASRPFSKERRPFPTSQRRA
jgi:hypothetical protein